MPLQSRLQRLQHMDAEVGLLSAARIGAGWCHHEGVRCVAGGATLSAHSWKLICVHTSMQWTRCSRPMRPGTSSLVRSTRRCPRRQRRHKLNSTSWRSVNLWAFTNGAPDMRKSQAQAITSENCADLRRIELKRPQGGVKRRWMQKCLMCPDPEAARLRIRLRFGQSASHWSPITMIRLSGTFRMGCNERASGSILREPLALKLA